MSDEPKTTIIQNPRKIDAPADDTEITITNQSDKTLAGTLQFSQQKANLDAAYGQMVQSKPEIELEALKRRIAALEHTVNGRVSE